MDKKTFKLFVEKLPIELQKAIHNCVDFLRPDINAIDDEILASLKALNPDVYETILKGLRIGKNEPLQVLQYIFLRKENRDLQYGNINELDADVLIWEGDVETDDDLVWETGKLIIINGHLRCKNLVVNDTTVVINGNLDCELLYGASGNDKCTHIYGSLHVDAILENGHYIICEGIIAAKDMVILHNKIVSSKQITADCTFEIGRSNKARINPLITDDSGCFDENKFFQLLAKQVVYSILVK